MTAPITPDERAALRGRADGLRVLARNGLATPSEQVYATDVPRLLDALDTAEAEVGLQRERLRSREMAAGRLRAEVTRLHAEVARLRAETLRAARPAPVWDEDTVTEAVARAMFPHYFTDDRQPLRVFTETRSDAELREAERESARRKARQALAVVREHLPVSGESRATVQAEALREAAATFAARLPDGTGNGRAYNSHQVADMLTARADRIEKGETR